MPVRRYLRQLRDLTVAPRGGLCSQTWTYASINIRRYTADPSLRCIQGCHASKRLGPIPCVLVGLTDWGPCRHGCFCMAKTIEFDVKRTARSFKSMFLIGRRSSNISIFGSRIPRHVRQHVKTTQRIVRISAHPGSTSCAELRAFQG